MTNDMNFAVEVRIAVFEQLVYSVSFSENDLRNCFSICALVKQDVESQIGYE